MNPLDQLSLFDLTPSTSSSEGSLDHASHSASQGSKKARKTSVTSGLISHDSSETSDPVGYWLRTYLASELSRLTSSSKTWRNQGTPLGRSWWVLTTSEARTVAKGCGLSAGSDWPAPTAHESETRTNCGGSNGRVGPERPMLAGAVGLWASPQARDWKDSGPTQGNRKSPNLGTQVFWGTPRAGTNGGIGRDRGDNKSRLEDQVHAGLLALESPSTHGKRQDWPAPRTTDATGGPDPTRGSLNPAWVTQLMNFPDGWLDSEPPTPPRTGGKR